MGMLDEGALRILVALFVGLLVGAERERRKVERPAGDFAGLRTFGLVGMLGGLLAHAAIPALLVAGAVLVGGAALVGYVVGARREQDRGMTTELALVVTYALGALALSEPALSAALGVLAAGMLALRGVLHTLVGSTLSRDELRDGLVFLLLALVVLPAMPDVDFGPYHAVNPARLARLVVLLTGITGAGYVAQRLLGPRFGLVLSGLAGGFVSSSGTIAGLGQRAREAPENVRGAVAGAMGSSIATAVEYGVLIGATDPALLGALALPLGLAGVCATLFALGFALSDRTAAQATARAGRAFRLSTVLAFAAALTLLTVLARALESVLGELGIVALSGVAALVDAHSTSGAVALLHHGGSLDTHTAALAVLTALSTNTLTKLAMAAGSRTPRYTLSVAAGVLSMAGAAWLGFWLRPPR